jgi:hypothetical protein
MIAVALCLALVSANPQAELTKGIVAFGRGDLSAARKHLDEAESQTTEPTLLARIHRQRGIIDQVEGKRLASVVSFLRALYFDPKIELSEREHRGEVQKLFTCAKALNEAGVSEKAVEIRYADRFQRADWSCPTGEKPPPPPPVAPPPPPIAAPPPPAVEEESVASSPWLWIGIAAGVVAIAGATTAGVLLAGGEDPYAGSTGVNIRLER